jgi:hypothetical protein
MGSRNIAAIPRIVTEGATILAIDDDPDVLEVEELHGAGNSTVRRHRGDRRG